MKEKKKKTGDSSRKCFKSWFILQKAYFDKGLAVSVYVKYLIAFFGLASLDVLLTMIIGVIYAVLAYFLGMFWFKFRLVEEEQEVQNLQNRFVAEVRGKI